MDYEYKQNRVWATAIVLIVIFIVGTIAVANAYGSTLAREEQIQRYAIVQQRGGEPFCLTPDGSVLVKFPNLQHTPGETG